MIRKQARLDSMDTTKQSKTPNKAKTPNCADKQVRFEGIPPSEKSENKLKHDDEIDSTPSDLDEELKDQVFNHTARSKTLKRHQSSKKNPRFKKQTTLDTSVRHNSQIKSADCTQPRRKPSRIKVNYGKLAENKVSINTEISMMMTEAKKTKHDTIKKAFEKSNRKDMKLYYSTKQFSMGGETEITFDNAADFTSKLDEHIDKSKRFGVPDPSYNDFVHKNKN